jgi:methionine-rich copper-binding protein CopC
MTIAINNWSTTTSWSIPKSSARALVAVLCLGTSAPAFAHAELASASPSVGATVQIAPMEVSITFTEKVAPRFSGIEVLDAKGKRVDQGAAHTAAKRREALERRSEAVGSGGLQGELARHVSR